MGKSIACILFPKLHYSIVFGPIGSNNCGEEGKDESLVALVIRDHVIVVILESLEL